MKSETGGVKVLMDFEQDTVDAAKAQPARPQSNYRCKY